MQHNHIKFTLNLIKLLINFINQHQSMNANQEVDQNLPLPSLSLETNFVIAFDHITALLWCAFTKF